MRTAPTTTDSRTYKLVNKRQFAITTTLIGLFVGGAVGLAGSGPFAQHVVQAVLITAFVSGGLYWTLLALADAVTGGTGLIRVASPIRQRTPTTEHSGSVDDYATEGR